jgi:hypothetical protein
VSISLKSAATNYIAQGYRVVPIPPRSKGPTIPGWNTHTFSPDDFSDDANLGILLGEPSGLVDIDLDDPKAAELAPQYLPPTPAKFGRASKPNSHWIYKVANPLPSRRFSWPEKKCIVTKRIIKKCIVEYRSTGSQTVFPPSIHPSGEQIQWTYELSATPNAPPWASSEAAFPQNSQECPFPLPATVDGLELGQAVERLTEAVRATRKGNLASLPNITHDAPITNAERCRLYLEKCPDSITGSGGHSALFLAACETQRFGLEQNDAWEILQWFNKNKCQPEWSDREISHKLAQAQKKVAGEGQLGSRLLEVNPMPPEIIVGTADTSAAKSTIQIKAGREPVVTCMADVNAREIAWYWQDKIPAARITLLAGMPGLGKSLLTTDITSRTTTGTAFPDGSPCQQGSVLLISAEDDPADTIRPRLDAAQADAAKVYLLSGTRLTNPDGKQTEIFFTLNDIETLEQALSAIPDCRLIIIDPIGSFLGQKNRRPQG